ncbi:MAG: phospholipase D family protein [Rhizobiaceae bacterium]
MGGSGLLLVADNKDAFAVRVLMAREARQNLDLMYYIWRADRTGKLLAHEVFKAADRGVKVRMLLDDINPSNSDADHRALNNHPNIELRLFNPSKARHGSYWRFIELIANRLRLTRRMHNKAWIADGRLALIGGRNVADEYFDAAETNFRDLDVLLQGDAATQTQMIFDAFWNCGGAKPLSKTDPLPMGKVVKWLRPDRREMANERVRLLRERADSLVSVDGLIKERGGMKTTEMARVVSDPPEKALGKLRKNWLMAELLPAVRSARERLDMVSPYFIPGKRGVALLNDLVERGVRTTVLTNSLAATDVAAVHGAYANYRRALLKCGVHLHELQPFARRKRISVFGSKGASLHAKAFTVDGNAGFIGSFNFDPRSASLNTEMGVLFEDSRLADEMQALFRQDIAPDTSYHLSLEQGRIHWRGDDDGALRDYKHEPEASLGRRAIALLVRYLPIESQL